MDFRKSKMLLDFRIKQAVRHLQIKFHEDQVKIEVGTANIQFFNMAAAAVLDLLIPHFRWFPRSSSRQHSLKI